LADELATLADELDLEGIAAQDLPTVVEACTRIERIGHAVAALAAGRLAATSTWRGHGDRSAAEWLARTTGRTSRAAGALIGTGTKLGNLPGTATAARRGELSPGQAAAIADA